MSQAIKASTIVVVATNLILNAFLY